MTSDTCDEKRHCLLIIFKKVASIERLRLSRPNVKEIKENNALAQNSLVSMAVVRYGDYSLVDLSPYSYDLVPFDYHLFPNMKKKSKNIWLGTIIAVMMTSYLLLMTFWAIRMNSRL